jgi:cation diffusion facilitator family transporter
MLIANGKNMQNDVIISFSVLLGLAFIYIFKMPILDTITALFVSLWVLRVAYKIFMQTSLELMDGTKDCTIYERIFDAIEAVEGAHHPHRVRSRNIGHKVMIAIDLEVDGELTLREAHEIAHKVEDSIKARIENVFDVVIHIEPIGDEIEEKPLGISKTGL